MKLNEQQFRLGSSVILEESDAEGNPGIMCRWQDNGKTFILRQQIEADRNMPSSRASANEKSLLGTSWGLWLFGKDSFCKVRSWHDAMEDEKDTIDFVHTCCPTIPLPEVIFSWIDREWSRTFIITRRIPGKTLDRRWWSLTESQRSEIARQVAEYCRDLSRTTSSNLESATKGGLLDYHLNDVAPKNHPSCKMRLVGPYSFDDLNLFLRRRMEHSDQPLPSFENTFHFYHLLLSPASIMISEEGKVTGILDWGSAGFVPKFWFTLKTLISAGFILEETFEGQLRSDRFPWAFLLHDALVAEGFEDGYQHGDWYKSIRHHCISED